MSSYTNSQNYSFAEYLSNGLPAPANPAPDFFSRFGPNQQSPSDPVLGVFNRSGASWACLLNTPLQAQLEVGSLCQHLPVLASGSSWRLYALLALLVRSGSEFLDLSGPTLLDPSDCAPLDPYGRLNPKPLIRWFLRIGVSFDCLLHLAFVGSVSSGSLFST